MGFKGRSYIDDLVDEFGYDYVIGYCLCSEYRLISIAENEEDDEKRKSILKKANRFAQDRIRLARERFDYGL